MSAYLPPPEQPVIRHVDADLLIVDKPAGLLSVPGRGDDKQDCLLSRVQVAYPDALAVHRLDMSTSGLLVLARGKAMHSELSRLFRERLVDKRYIAVIDGLPAAEAGEIDLPLICDWPNRPRQKVDHSIGKPSLTRFRILERCPARQCTLVELEPVTGRSHQLRVHLASLGHPILGDDLYGGEATARAERLLLHAAKIAFIHPSTAARLEISSPPPFSPAAAAQQPPIPL
ncbi:MAG: RluA family pseudouridine synthase [Azonexaceae bacterium]|nr:RluA family pseudouridine synthase [Azonexaceae bacterium]